VFVDFTAAWCVTCQYNKKTTLANAAVLADFESRNKSRCCAPTGPGATRPSPAALAQLGRSGVPVYVVYRQGRAPWCCPKCSASTKAAPPCRPLPSRSFAMLRRALLACRFPAARHAGVHAAPSVGQPAPDFT
jgi:hypothetical protein